MTWIYWESEPGLWTVGYYKPDGQREPESDHETAGAAAAQVHYLNGGPARALEGLRSSLHEDSEDSRAAKR